jgi:lantibiotic transport system ATP-binding protein
VTSAVTFPDGIRTEGLTRRFGHQTAVDGVSLAVPSGAVYGFLGPNGSGKTTTIRMLLGLIAPNAGSIEVLGRPMPSAAGQVLPHVGALIEGPAFHPYLSGLENLRRLDACDRTADPATRKLRIEAALHRVGLWAAARKRYRQYSLGMKQRLGLAAAMLQPRELLILDEPTNGLDPQGTREVRNLVRSLAADGTTVLVSSHLLSEVEQVATHVGIMSAGRLLAQGTLDEVLGNKAATLRVETTEVEVAAGLLTRMGLAAVVPDPATGLVTALVGTARPEDVNAQLVQAGVPVRGLRIERPGLEDLFVSLTGEGFDVVN